MMVFLAAT